MERLLYQCDIQSWPERIATESIEGGERWRTIEDAMFGIVVNGSLHYIFIEAHFETDFNSLPKPFARRGKHEVAGLLHDWLYYDGTVERRLADSMYYAGLRFSGIGFIAAKIMYFGVRLGGFSAWRRHRKARG
jgi:hypothetical protein